MKRGFLWVALLSLIGLSGVWSASAATFNSTNFSINGNIGDSAAGAQNSTNYRMTSSAGESIAGNSASGSYKLGQGYIATLENSIQLNVQPNGLAGEWSFDQGSGTTVVDDSLNNTSAIFTGSPAFTPGKSGQGITNFSATNFLTATNDSVYNVSAFTACVWANLSSTSSNPVAFSRSNGTFDTSGMWSIGFGTGLSPRVRVYTDTATTLFNSSATVSFGTWNQICMTYGANTVTMYLNGASIATQSTTGSLGTLSGRPLGFGALPNGTQPLMGSMDEAKFYSRALTASEVKADYDAQNSGLTSGLSLNALTPGISQTQSFDSVIQTSSAGYVLAINQNNNLTSGGNSIPPVSGSIASPVSWSESSTKGLGFTLYGTNATALPGTWSLGNAYAALPSTGTTFYTRTGLNGGVKDVVNMRLRLDTTTAQASGNYTNQMTITGTMTP